MGRSDVCDGPRGAALPRVLLLCAELEGKDRSAGVSQDEKGPDHGGDVFRRDAQPAPDQNMREK